MTSSRPRFEYLFSSGSLLSKIEWWFYDVRLEPGFFFCKQEVSMGGSRSWILPFLLHTERKDLEVELESRMIGGFSLSSTVRGVIGACGSIEHRGSSG